MTAFVRASGVAGAALIAFVASPSWALDLNAVAMTSSVAVSVAEASITAAAAARLQPSASNPPPAAVAAPIVAVAVPAPVVAMAAIPAAPVAAPPAPAPVRTAAAAPGPARVGAATARPAGFSAFFPTSFAQSVAQSASAAVSSVAAIPGRLGGVISHFLSSDTKDAEHECLATAVYYESKSEPLEGQLAVAQVVLNRAASGRYPSSVCGVVKQRAQFSFVHRGRLPQPPRSSEAWQRAVAVAEVAREKLANSIAANATAFHATYVAPTWRNSLTRIARIGMHVFYR